MGKIKQIKLNTNGTPSLQPYKIGADIEDIDYKISNESTKSVREILGEFQTDDASVKEELDNNKQHISNLAEQFLNIEQDFSTIQKKFEEAEPKLDTLIDLDNIVSEKVTNKVNSKKFSTDDIIWTDGIPVNLHKILGNLRNLPLQATNLRDWIEKISAMGGNGGSSPGGGGSSPGGGGGGGGGEVGGVSVMPIGSTPATISVSRLFHSDNATGFYHSPEFELLTDEQKNISNWQKNMQSFPQFDNTYTNGRNRLAYTGGSGYERIYLPVDLTGFGTFSFDMRCPMNGYNCSYGSDTEYAFISKFMPDTGALQYNSQNIVAYAELPKTSSNAYTRIEMNVNTPGTYYFGIDLGYIVDGVPITIDISNISCICIQNYYYNYSQEVN